MHLHDSRNIPPDQLDGSSERIAKAVRNIQSERLAALSRRLTAARRRHPRHLIDEMIAVLEERNLRGKRRMDRVVRRWLGRLEAEIGVPIPPTVVRARNTARLHGALLDWMETFGGDRDRSGWSDDDVDDDPPELAAASRGIASLEQQRKNGELRP